MASIPPCYRPYHYIGLELRHQCGKCGIKDVKPTGCSLAIYLADVGAFAKKDLRPGDQLDGEGGYTVFGKLMSAEKSLSGSILPLGLTGQARVVKPVAKDAALTYDCVELDTSTTAYRLRKELESWGSS